MTCNTTTLVPVQYKTLCITELSYYYSLVSKCYASWCNLYKLFQATQLECGIQRKRREKDVEGLAIKPSVVVAHVVVGPSYPVRVINHTLDIATVYNGTKIAVLEPIEDVMTVAP